MRERSSQRRVVTGQDRQSVLQLLNLLLSRPHVELQTADPPKLVREDSLQTGIFLIRAFLNLIGAELLSEIHDRGGPCRNRRSIDLIQIKVETDRGHAPVCPFFVNSLKLGHVSFPGPLLGSF